MLRVPLVVLALAVLAAAAAPLAHADGGSVTIAPSGGGAARTLSLASLPADVHDVSYTLLAADGSTSRVTVADGISLGALLQAAGLDGDPYTYVEIPHPDGSSSTYVLADRVGDAGNGPPVVWSDQQGVHFLRPSDGDGDANAGDDLTFADGALSIALHTGELLVPHVSVSPSPGRPHEPIVFNASLEGGSPLPAGMAFQWYFDGGRYVPGARVTHRFPAAATYKVELNIVRGGAHVTYLPTIVHVRISAAAKPARRAGAAQGAVIVGGAPGAGGGTGSAGGAGTGGTVAAAQPTPLPAATALRRLAPPPAPRPPRGQLVSGTLIASASAALPLAGGDAAAAAATSTANADRPLHVPIGAWVALGLAALLGLGWALESRHTLPFWQP